MARVAVFKPLTQEGKGVWSWKEFDHRLYAFRGPDRDGRTQIVLLSGWVKDKAATIAGSIEERREVEKAQALKVECEREIDWTKVTPKNGGNGGSVETKDEAAMVSVKEPEKAAAIPDRPAEEAPLVSPEEEPVAVSVVPATAAEVVPSPVPEPKTEPKEKVFGVPELAQLSGAPEEWIRDAILRCELPEGALRNGARIWRWEDADAVVARVEQLRGTKKEALAVAKHICPHCAKEFDRWISLRGHLAQHSGLAPKKPLPASHRGVPRGYVSIEGLAKMLGVHSSTINNLIHRGLIEPGTKTASRRLWTKKQAEAIVERHLEFRKRLDKYSIGFKKGKGGTYSCPGCGEQSTSPGGLLSHLKTCRVMWDGFESPVDIPAETEEKVWRSTLAYVVEHPEVTVAEMATHLYGNPIGENYNKAYRHLDSLDGCGILRRSGEERSSDNPLRYTASKKAVAVLADPSIRLADLKKETATRSEIPTRAELLQLAERVIDNAADPEEFVRLVREHVVGVQRMEQELQRIRGGK